jgi:hypothetical protein
MSNGRRPRLGAALSVVDFGWLSAHETALRLLAALGGLAVAACGSSDTPDDSTPDIAKLQNPETCKKCHADHYDEWSGSMHAYASIDPVFRAMNARGQKETNGELGEFCVKCHAPLAFELGMTKNGTDLDKVDAAYQGVTCYFCHQVTDVQGAHNNPLIIAKDATMRGGYENPTKNEAHHSAYSSLHDSNQPGSAKLCGACHDISVPAHFSGAPQDVDLERTFAEWQTSVFATSSPQLTCGGCHFKKISGIPIANYPGVRSRPIRHGHMFPAVDVALTDFPNKDEQRAAVQDLLSTSLRVQICFQPQIGQKVWLQFENVSVAHDLPSGATQDRRLWAEVHVYDNPTGQPYHEVLSLGVVPPGTSVTDLVEAQPNVILYRDEGLDKDGNPADMFWQIASEKKYPTNSGIDAIRGTIGVALTSDLTDPRWHKNREVLTPSPLDVPFGTSHVTVTFHMQPIGRDVLDDLVNGGYLDASIRDAMPTFDFLPNDGVPVTADWTTSAAAAANNPGLSGTLCVETAPPRQ